MATQRTFPLNTGATIPAFGYGTWKSPPDEVYNGVLSALKSGYRHIDCAWAYENESSVGKAIADSGVPRSEIFVTSKLWSTWHTDVAAGMEETLKNLGLDYLDLYLMHWPVAMNPKGSHPVFPLREDGTRDLLRRDFAETWAQLQALPKEKIHAIGVSNFSIPHLKHLFAHPKFSIPPAVNQVELHPYLPQPALAKFCKENHNILLTAFCPLGSNNPVITGSEAMVSLAKNFRDGSYSVQRILLSWGISKGWPVLPKSLNAERIKGNFEGDFVMTEEEVKAVDEATGGKRIRTLSPSWGVKIFAEDPHVEAEGSWEEYQGKGAYF